LTTYPAKVISSWQPPIIRNELHKRIDLHFDHSFLAANMEANYIPDEHLSEWIDFKTLSSIMVF